MAGYCRDCRADLEHCHGTLIRHTVRGPECTEGGCAGAEILPHAFAIDCDAVGCRCSARPALAV